jgi:hypothetical protein
MANIDIKYGLIVYLNATLAISEFDNIFFVFFILLTWGQSDRGQSDQGTKWPGDKVTGDKVTKGTKWPGDKVTGD